jgi:hypothetical protein
VAFAISLPQTSYTCKQFILPQQPAKRRVATAAAKTVAAYNTRIRQIPEVLVAVLLGMNPRELFQTNDAERQVTQVKFS